MPVSSLLQKCSAAAAAAAALITLAACSTGSAPTVAAGGNLAPQRVDDRIGKASAQAASSTSTYVQSLSREALALKPLVRQPLATSFLEQVKELPSPEPRVTYESVKLRHRVSQSAWQSFSPSVQATFTRKEHSDEYYYSRSYGSPLAYARALELLGEQGLTTLAGLRVLDIGYGAMAAPRMMARAGAQVHGVDVDPSLPQIYNLPSDQGHVAVSNGSLTLHDGIFGFSQSLMSALKIDGAKGIAAPRAAARAFDIIITKNTMKRGFMRPKPGQDAIVAFFVSDAQLLQALYDSLAPGGYFMIYNAGQAFDPDKPSTDAASPFTREQFEQARFKVIALDQSDDDALRAMGRVFGWDRQMGDLNTNLFGLYTLVRR